MQVLCKYTFVFSSDQSSKLRIVKPFLQMRKQEWRNKITRSKSQSQEVTESEFEPRMVWFHRWLAPSIKFTRHTNLRGAYGIFKNNQAMNYWCMYSLLPLPARRNTVRFACHLSAGWSGIFWPVMHSQVLWDCGEPRGCWEDEALTPHCSWWYAWAQPLEGEWQKGRGYGLALLT